MKRRIIPSNLKRFFIQAQKADPSPPLGTVLGNSGLNTIKFCNEFNIYTEKLPIIFFIKSFGLYFTRSKFSF